MPSPYNSQTYLNTSGPSFLQKAGSAIGNAFSQLKAGFKNLSDQNFQGPYSAPNDSLKVPQYYQVGSEDSDIFNVSNKLGVSPQDMINTNKTKTLPPVGSYMENPNYIRQQNRFEQMDAERAPLDYSTAINAQKINQIRDQAQNFVINPVTGKLALNLPAVIPVNAQRFIVDPKTGRQITDLEMLANGYIKDQTTQSWKFQGTGTGTGVGIPTAQPQSGNNWQTNPSLHIVNYHGGQWSEGGQGFETTEKWATNAARRARRSNGPVKKAGPNSRGGASTILDLHLGSG